MMLQLIMFEIFCNEIDRLYKECLSIMLLKEQVAFYELQAIYDITKLQDMIQAIKSYTPLSS